MCVAAMLWRKMALKNVRVGLGGMGHTELTVLMRTEGACLWAWFKGIFKWTFRAPFKADVFTQSYGVWSSGFNGVSSQWASLDSYIIREFSPPPTLPFLYISPIAVHHCFEIFLRLMLVNAKWKPPPPPGFQFTVMVGLLSHHRQALAHI